MSRNAAKIAIKKAVKPRRHTSRPMVEEVEPRIPVSADFPPTLADSTALTATAEQRTVNPAGEYTPNSTQDNQARRHELVLVESNTPDYENLVADIVKQAGEG